MLFYTKSPSTKFTAIRPFQKLKYILASLDNAARAVLPPLYAVIAQDLNVTEASLGVITALSILVMYMTSLATTYRELMTYHLLTAIGIGCIASVGFSIVTDLIPPQRRGLMMSFWGLSQAGGGGFGSLLGSMLGASNWRIPFVFTAIAGFVFAMLYFYRALCLRLPLVHWYGCRVYTSGAYSRLDII